MKADAAVSFPLACRGVLSNERRGEPKRKGNRTMWKKKKVNQEATTEAVKEPTLLHTLCGDEPELLNFASSHLCVNPMTAISTKSLEVLMDEAAKNGDYRPALDKAIFEAAQHPEQTASYMTIVQDIAAKTLTATEKEKALIEKQGLTDRAAFLQKRIESQKLMQNRTADVLNVATRYYQERLLELGEDAKRAGRIAERKETEGEELRAEQEKQTQREARKREMKGMGRAERKEAERQDRLEEQAAEARREARETVHREAEMQEEQIENREDREREARKNNLRGG
jgi:hypothetical protein